MRWIITEVVDEAVGITKHPINPNEPDLHSLPVLGPQAHVSCMTERCVLIDRLYGELSRCGAKPMNVHARRITVYLGCGCIGHGDRYNR